MVNLDIETNNMPPQAHIMDRMSSHSVSLRKDIETFENSDKIGESEKIKCVLVGDGSIGKSSLIVSYTTNGFPTEYVPTAFDNYSVVVTVDNQPIRFQLCDTAGQDDFDNLRPLCYPQTQVFLLCFSVVNPTSYLNITQKWLPEIRKHNPKTPYVLIGTQCDLRNDVKVLIELANYNECPIDESEAQRTAERIGAAAYLECSALTQKNLKQVFDMAIITAMDRCGHFNDSLKKRKSKSKRKSKTKEKDILADDCAAVKRGWKKLCCFL